MSWYEDLPRFPAPIFFNGMLVKLDKGLTEAEFVIDNPSRFVEYEPKDYGWLAYFKMGRWVQVPSKNAYVIEVDANRKTLVMHPDTWEKVKRHLDNQKEEREEHMGAVPKNPHNYLKGL